MSLSYSYLLKYIIIGDSAVGKSNLLLRYAHEKFNEDYQATIGIEFGSKNIEIDNEKYRIQIWDTAGQENFKSLTRAYYKNSVCAIIVYDITNKQSFNNINTWIDDCKNQSPKTIFFVLVGNKSDLENKRQVNYNEGLKFAQENNILFFESSAKTGKNVEDIFYKSAKIISEKIKEGIYDLENDSCGIKKGGDKSNNIIGINDDDEGNKKCC
jgi:small GTP-binding protein